MRPIQYLKQSILAFGTPLSLIITLALVPLILPIAFPLIFLALIILLVLVLLALLLVLMVLLVILLRQLPQILLNQATSIPEQTEASKTRHVQGQGHVRTSTGSSNSIISRRKASIDSQNPHQHQPRMEGFSRSRLGSCHEPEAEADTMRNTHDHSGFMNGESTAVFGIDSPRKGRFV